MEKVETWVDIMLDMLWNHLWQSTLFAGAVALLTLAFRRNRAHVRYWLWLAASVKFLIPFSALLWIGAQIELLPIARSGQAIVSVLDNAAEPFTQPQPVRIDRRGRPVPPPPPSELAMLAERSFRVCGRRDRLHCSWSGLCSGAGRSHRAGGIRNH